MQEVDLTRSFRVNKIRRLIQETMVNASINQYITSSTGPSCIDEESNRTQVSINAPHVICGPTADQRENNTCRKHMDIYCPLTWDSRKLNETDHNT